MLQQAAEGLPDIQLSGMRSQVSAALGLQAGAPPKPLLWKAAGHPASPPSQELWEAAERLQRLCAAAAASSISQNTAVVQLVARALQGLTDAGMHAAGEAASEEEAVRQLAESRAAAVVAAALPADWELRRALQEGVALFAVALARASGHDQGQQLALPDGETAGELDAVEVVELLQGRMEAAVKQVGPTFRYPAVHLVRQGGCWVGRFRMSCR